MKYFWFYNSYLWLDLNFFEFLNNYCVFYEGLKQFKCIERTSFLLVVAVWWNRFRMMECWKSRLISFFICSQYCRRRERILKMQKKRRPLCIGAFFSVPLRLLFGFAKHFSHGGFHACDRFRNHTNFFWGAVGGDFGNFILEHVSRMVNVSAEQFIRWNFQRIYNRNKGFEAGDGIARFNMADVSCTGGNEFG